MTFKTGESLPYRVRGTVSRCRPFDWLKHQLILIYQTHLWWKTWCENVDHYCSLFIDGWIQAAATCWYGALFPLTPAHSTVTLCRCSHGRVCLVFKALDVGRIVPPVSPTLFICAFMPFADVGGGRTARCYWMGVELAGRQRSTKCPKHSTETQQWPRTQLGKKQTCAFNIGTHSSYRLYRHPEQ